MNFLRPISIALFAISGISSHAQVLVKPEGGWRFGAIFGNWRCIDTGLNGNRPVFLDETSLRYVESQKAWVVWLRSLDYAAGNDTMEKQLMRFDIRQIAVIAIANRKIGKNEPPMTYDLPPEDWKWESMLPGSNGENVMRLVERLSKVGRDTFSKEFIP